MKNLEYRMQAVAYYLSLPFIYLIAWSPFWLMYLMSDFLYHVFKLTGYRKKVVYTNFKNSFPEKSETEIKALCDVYFKYLTDLILESFKTLTLSEKDINKHCVFHKAAWLDKLYEEKRSIIIVMGHYGNWELAGPSFTLNNKYQLNVAYKPLSNPYFESLFVKMRTKFGTRITPATNTLREMVATRKEITATALIADQTATPENAYWTNFLNQDTAVFIGPEKLSKKFNYPIVYMSVNRVKRGFYEITPELLFENPTETADNEICEAFTRRLEKEIINDPSTWLWSHKRWKHKRPSSK